MNTNASNAEPERGKTESSGANSGLQTPDTEPTTSGPGTQAGDAKASVPPSDTGSEGSEAKHAGPTAESTSQTPPSDTGSEGSEAKHAGPSSSTEESGLLKDTALTPMIVTNVALAIFLAAVLVYLVAFSPYLPIEGAQPPVTEGTSAPTAADTLVPTITDTSVPTTTDTSVPTAARAQPPTLNTSEAGLFREILIYTLVTMAIAGAAGGTLCNLRGLFVHTRDEGGLRIELKVPYYIRPLIGALTGLFIFFLGNLISSSLSVNAANESWASLAGRIPYIAVALLVGFASQEFMNRLKLTAETLFSQTIIGELDTEAKLRIYETWHKRGLINDDELKDLRKAILDKQKSR